MQDLSRCCHQWCNSHPLEPPPKNSGKGIGDSSGKAGELGQHAATQTAQGVWTNHHRGADETHDNAGTLLGRQLFIGRHHMCDKDCKQRRCRIQDGCQTTRDAMLASHDEDKG